MPKRDNAFTRMTEVEVARSLDYNDDEFVQKCMQYRTPLERTRIEWLHSVYTHVLSIQRDVSKLPIWDQKGHERCIQVSRDFFNDMTPQRCGGLTYKEALKLLGYESLE